MSKRDKKIKLTDGRTLSYAEYGAPNGKPLFYFHGWPDSRLRVSSVTNAAKSLGIRLISIDRPGYGFSDYKEDRKLLDWPDDVVELADSLKIKKFSIIGVSGGGPYAATCAYKIPERINRVGIVVGLAPTYIPGILSNMPLLYRIGWANYSKYPFTAYLGAWYRELITKYFDILISKFDFRGGNDRDILKSITGDWRKLNREAFRQGSKGARHDLFLYTREWGFKLRDIDIGSKVYLWYGEADLNVPLAMGKYYEKQIRNSKLKVYKGEGHLISVAHCREIFKTLIS